MATLKDFRNERLRKLQQLVELGFNPYPSKVDRSHKLSEIINDFDKLQGQAVKVVGRVISIRKFGKLAFVVIRDYSDKVQLFLQKDKLSETDSSQNYLGLDNLSLLDSGDFVEADGQVIKTQTGEISIEVKSLKLLVKSLRPMPNQLDGFTNKEERLRRRYVDMNLNLEVRERFVRRSRFWQATRDFLNKNDFIEINTPILEHTTGGADAKPFMTHMDALDQDFYLRISHELPLKRLLGAGYEKVYDIGARFRNEGYSDEHLPEHIAMEWYWAYANWQDGMKFMEEMYKYVLNETFGKLEFDLNGKKVDMACQWQIWDYADTVNRHYNIDIYDTPIDQLKDILKSNKIEIQKADDRSRLVDKLWKNIRKDVVGPVWLVNTPKFISPLSKTNLDDERTVERFQPIIAGSELGNGFSELNDPIEQLNRFIEQQKMREAGDDEAMMLDIDYIEMLEYGMPPACGWGYSERVFWTFEDTSAREGVPFPQMRSEIDNTTRDIYPNIKFDS